MSPRRRRRPGRRPRLFDGPLDTEMLGSGLLVAIPSFFLLLLFLGPGLHGSTDWSRPMQTLTTGGVALALIVAGVLLLIMIIWWRSR